MNIKYFLSKKHIFTFLLILASFTTMAGEVRAEDARELIKTTAEEIISHVKTNRSGLENDPSQLYALVNEKIVPFVDFPRMSRWILGKNWRKASDAQKAQFTEEFKKLLIKTYATALLKLSNEVITYPSVKNKVKNGKVSIKSEVILPGGQRFSLQYRMHHKDQNWKIYDVSVDGVSLISTYRSSFSTEIRKVGLEGLIANLVNKNKGFKI